MLKRLLSLLILAALAAAAFWYFERSPEIERAAIDVSSRLVEVAEKVSREASAPPPLRAEEDVPGARLTALGIVEWTNAHRAEQGLPPLKAEDRLANAARRKAEDMFARQYFAHVSPGGEGPSDFVEASGYAFISVGENLALGSFRDDRTLVQAWMDSHGHRANILDGGFREIGAAAIEGTYEGRRTWISVQMFGRPLSDCPQPDPALKAEIERDEAELEALKAQAEKFRAELESEKPRTRGERAAYNRKVDEYNALARRINALIDEIQGEITVYNGQVQAFNACATE